AFRLRPRPAPLRFPRQRPCELTEDVQRALQPVLLLGTGGGALRGLGTPALRRAGQRLHEPPEHAERRTQAAFVRGVSLGPRTPRLLGVGLRLGLFVGLRLHLGGLLLCFRAGLGLSRLLVGRLLVLRLLSWG